MIYRFINEIIFIPKIMIKTLHLYFFNCIIIYDNIQKYSNYCFYSINVINLVKFSHLMNHYELNHLYLSIISFLSLIILMNFDNLFSFFGVFIYFLSIHIIKIINNNELYHDCDGFTSLVNVIYLNQFLNFIIIPFKGFYHPLLFHLYQLLYLFILKLFNFLNKMNFILFLLIYIFNYFRIYKIF